MSGGVSATTIFAGLGAAAAVYSASQSGKGGGMPGIPAPAAPGPTVMPLPDGDAMKAAQRKLQASLASRRGRESTILNDPAAGDLLGA